MASGEMRVGRTSSHQHLRGTVGRAQAMTGRTAIPVCSIRFPEALGARAATAFDRRDTSSTRWTTAASRAPPPRRPTNQLCPP